MNVAVCGALARWAGSELDADALLTIAMNVEAQVIKAPTGVQDYRPAYYGGVAAIELAPGRRSSALPIDVDVVELQGRLVLAYTGAPHFSGTNNWEITKRHIDGDRHVFECFEHIVAAASGLRDALARENWDGVACHLQAEWEARKQLAPGVTTPMIDELIAARFVRWRAAPRRSAVRAAAVACSAWPIRRMWPRFKRRCRLEAPGRSTTGSKPTDCGSKAPDPLQLPHCDWTSSDVLATRRRQGVYFQPSDPIRFRGIRVCPMENLAIARIFSEIADLLEIKSENPFKIRAYRNAAETIAHATERLACCTEEQLRAIPGIGKELASKIREIAETGEARYHRDLLEQFPPTILDLLHLQGVGPKTVAQLYHAARHSHRRRARGCVPGRTGSRAERPGVEEGATHPQGVCRAEAAFRTASPCRRRRSRGAAARLPPRRMPGRDVRRRWAAYAAARTRREISTSWRPEPIRT